MDIGYVFDEYPKPLAIIKPIFKDGKCYDFTYIYVNRALGIYLGVSSRELIGSNFLKHFVNGEECVIYENLEDMYAKAKFYLEHEEERQRIALNGLEKVQRDFTFENALKRILS